MKIRFYHVPKSGGTAIYNMTKNWKNFKRAHPKKNHVCICYNPPKSDETGMAVIRHPYSRFISAFYHMVDACDPKFYYKNAPVSDCNEAKKMGITNFGALYQNNPNYFLRALVDRNFPGHREAKKIFSSFSIFKSQFYWLSDIFGWKLHPGINILLHQENLRNEFNDLSRTLGQVPVWVNDNKRISQNIIPLTDVSKAIIRKMYKDDFKHFNFDI